MLNYHELHKSTFDSINNYQLKYDRQMNKNNYISIRIIKKNHDISITFH